MQNSKPWYTSKTLWANLIAAIGLVLNANSEVVPTDVLAAAVVIVNFILRLITKQPIDLGKKPPVGVPAIVLLAFCTLILTSCASTRTGYPAGYRADTTPGENGEDYVAVDRSAVVVRATSNGGAEIGFDLLGIRGYRPAKWAREAKGPMKILTYPADYVGYMVTDHPWQTLGIGLAAWEIKSNGVSDTLGSLFGSSGGGDKAPPKTDSAQTSTITVSGDNNYINVSASTSAIQEAPRTTSTDTRTTNN